MVDAHSGEILNKLNLVTDFSPGGQHMYTAYIPTFSLSTLLTNVITGDGNAYPTYPPGSSVTDEPLYRLNGDGHLDGTYANVVNDDVNRAYSGSESFLYAATNTHFDEVNLYYHIDKFRQGFIDQFGSDSEIGFTQVTAHAHGSPNTNAGFNPSNQELYFGDGYNSSYNDFAKSDQVIYHEYGHDVIYHINSEIQSSYNEEGAISEGTPDYFAGSFTGRSVNGDYVLDGNHPDKLRDMANPDPISSYSDYQNQQNYPYVEPHDGGEFFSSILWAIHNYIGASKTNTLVFKSLHGISGGPTFLEFRDAMMAADQEAYQGYDADLVQNTFADKGVGQYVPPGVSIQGPTGIFSGQTKTYTAYVSGGFPPFQYKWYYKDTQNSPWIGPVSTDDTYDYTAHSAPNDYLKLTVTDQHNSIIVQKRLTVAGLSN